MYLAMNRFRIALGQEDAFVQMWRERDSHLASVPGFVRFHLLRGATTARIDPFCSTLKTLSLICDIVDPVTRQPYTRDPRFIARKAEAWLKKPA